MGIVINLDVMMARRKKGLKELSAEVDLSLIHISIFMDSPSFLLCWVYFNRNTGESKCYPQMGGV